jgi:hypothetical protein
MAKRKAPGAWESRIVGHGEEDPAQLLANPLNWRTHPPRQRDAMRATLDQVGWVQQVLVNQRTGHVVDGHLRVEEALSRGEPTVPVVYVDLALEEERFVLATLDPLGAMAGTADDRLQELLGELTITDESLVKMLAGLTRDPGTAYTGTVNVPRYEPQGDEPPPTRDLYDLGKTSTLRAAIQAQPGLDPDLRAFLMEAAGRHTVFDYARIADFYAHASPEVQRLMEASALVIVDYENAIRDGYVRFNDTIGLIAEDDSRLEAASA